MVTHKHSPQKIDHARPKSKPGAAETSSARSADDAGWEIAEEVAEFLLSRRAINCTPGTLEWYERCTKKLQGYMAERGLRTTRQLNPSHIRRFLVSLQQAGHSPGGVTTLFTGVRAYLNWYAGEYALENWNPLAGVKPPKRPADPLPPVELTHVRQLVGACPVGEFNGDRDRALFYFALDSGARHQELANLRLEHVDQSGRVRIQLGKGQKSRTVFIGTRTLTALATYLAHRPNAKSGDPLWTQANGQQLSASGIRQVMRRRANTVGIPEPGLHAFRRAFAINSLRNGIDMISLQRLMGHSSLQTIHRYLAQVDDDLRQAHRKFGVVDGMVWGEA